MLGGVWAIRGMRLDAIPDLSDVQVIVYTEYPGQAPRVVEDQVTYPITTKMLAVPYAKVVRGYSFFGYLVRLRHLRGRHRPVLGAHPRARVPDGARPPAAGGCLAPARTRRHRGRLGVHVRAATRPQRTLAELRTLQDWYLKYALTAVDGVSEVASIGGFVRSTRSKSTR